MSEQRLAELERRLQQIEDERAIERLIASYGPLVDAGEADSAAALWRDDGVYDVENWLMAGREDIAAMVRSRGHQDLISRGCTHFLGPAVVTVHGDEAVAVCESTLLVKQGDEYRVARAAANYFHLRRAPEPPGRWQTVRRITRLLDGSAESHTLLADGAAGRIR
ncbi:nuclear transport factor 2 family protein [Mycolicibacter longobardus]|uniref:nuclear transport factor 2 family protein n=1 Tax=Mycolicibacter longobardus TaxID=1108812 RepID=UPI0021F2B2D8|nr:nuclear transport factor 2 family protein [Mycolicibacter longobardus]MCV7382255.1 nuclear transport factor 2 family protein [Mycolicibacter longobardus]